jgi:hypothetical protein
LLVGTAAYGGRTAPHRPLGAAPAFPPAADAEDHMHVRISGSRARGKANPSFFSKEAKLIPRRAGPGTLPVGTRGAGAGANNSRLPDPVALRGRFGASARASRQQRSAVRTARATMAGRRGSGRAPLAAVRVGLGHESDGHSTSFGRGWLDGGGRLRSLPLPHAGDDARTYCC